MCVCIHLTAFIYALFSLFAYEGHLWDQQVEQQKNWSDLLEQTEHKQHLNCSKSQQNTDAVCETVIVYHRDILKLIILK